MAPQRNYPGWLDCDKHQEVEALLIETARRGAQQIRQQALEAEIEAHREANRAIYGEQRASLSVATVSRLKDVFEAHPQRTRPATNSCQKATKRSTSARANAPGTDSWRRRTRLTRSCLRSAVPT